MVVSIGVVDCVVPVDDIVMTVVGASVCFVGTSKVVVGAVWLYKRSEIDIYKHLSSFGLFTFTHQIIYIYMYIEQCSFFPLLEL